MSNPLIAKKLDPLPDTVDPYTTKLNPSDEVRYQVWRAALPPDLRNDMDYDLRGAYSSGAKPTSREHFTDQYKKPNHITFSDQSMYSTPENMGGKWVETPGTDGGTFYATKANLIHHSPAELQQYFKTNEPKWKVQLP